MKIKFLIFALGVSLNCFSQKYSEDNKAIGDIYFGMPENVVDLKIEEFNKKSERPDKTWPELITHCIGNYRYLLISGEYYKDSLYLLTIEGYMIDWKYFDSQVPKTIEDISSVIKSKYGNLVINSSLKPSYNYKLGYSYLLRKWINKQRVVEIRLVVHDTFYMVNTIIKRIDIEKEKELLEKHEQEKNKNRAKDVF